MQAVIKSVAGRPAVHLIFQQKRKKNNLYPVLIHRKLNKEFLFIFYLLKLRVLLTFYDYFGKGKERKQIKLTSGQRHELVVYLHSQ